MKTAGLVKTRERIYYQLRRLWEEGLAWPVKDKRRTLYQREIHAFPDLKDHSREEEKVRYRREIKKKKEKSERNK